VGTVNLNISTDVDVIILKKTEWNNFNTFYPNSINRVPECCKNYSFMSDDFTECLSHLI